MSPRRELTPRAQARQDATEELLGQLERARGAARRADLVEQIVTLNLGIADALANRFVGRGVDRDDLVQIARLALFKAARRYRPGRGSGFGAYAVPTITGELKRCLRDQAWMIRPPRRLQELYLSAGAARGDLEQRHGRSVATRDVGAEMNQATEGLREAEAAAQACYRPTSLDEAQDLPGSNRHAAWLAVADDGLERATDLLTLRRAFGSLTTRDRWVVRMRFFDDLTQTEIAAAIGVSQMQVSRILKRVLSQLRGQLGEAC